MIDDFQKLLGCLRDLSRSELLTLDAAVRGILSAPPQPLPTAPPTDMPGTAPMPPAEPLRKEGRSRKEDQISRDQFAELDARYSCALQNSTRGSIWVWVSNNAITLPPGTLPCTGDPWVRPDRPGVLRMPSASDVL